MGGRGTDKARLVRLLKLGLCTHRFITTVPPVLDIFEIFHNQSQKVNSNQTDLNIKDKTIKFLQD